MLRPTASVLIAIFVCATGFAQQLETNDAAGALVGLSGPSHPGTEVEPVPGAPVFIPALGGSSARLRLKGAPETPFILIVGELATKSVAVAAGNPATEWFDLDLGGLLHVVADGFGGGGNALFANLGSTGTADFAFPTSGALSGFTFAFQGVTLDPGAPFGLNFTGAVAYVVSDVAPLQSIAADDAVIDFQLGTPICFAGSTHPRLQLSTNGFLRFGEIAVPDLGVAAARLVNGTMGWPASSAPGIAMAWDDLHTAATPLSALTVVEVAPGIVHAEWRHFSYLTDVGLDCGTMSLTLDSSAGFTLLTLDYSATTFASAGSLHRGVVGVTCGAQPMVTITAGDLASGGLANQLGGAPGPGTIYQDFVATGPIDLSGVVLHFSDVACDGAFMTF